MPALSADAAVREKWFEALKDVANRRREPWVLDGLEYLHHPRRAAVSAKYVRPSLDLLWEIQKTGDIFFPKRWMDATLGGYRAPFVATTVRDFLAAAPPSYPAAADQHRPAVGRRAVPHRRPPVGVWHRRHGSCHRR